MNKKTPAFLDGCLHTLVRVKCYSKTRQIYLKHFKKMPVFLDVHFHTLALVRYSNGMRHPYLKYMRFNYL